MVCRNTLNSRKIDCLRNGVGTRCRFFNFIACALWYRADREGWVRNSIFFVFPLFFYLFFTFFCSVWLILSVSIHAYCWATLQFPIEKINVVVHTWILAKVPTSLSYYRIRGYSPFNKLQDVHEKKQTLTKHFERKLWHICKNDFTRSTRAKPRKRQTSLTSAEQNKK